MRKFFSEYKKPAISAVVFFVTLVGMTSAYAAFTALTDVITGQTLSKDAWNTMVANLNDLNGRSVPQGAVMSFNLATCPNGWSEYAPARGRFIRGIDNGAGNDPSGTRALENVQADELKTHSHTYVALQNSYPNDGYINGGTAVGHWGPWTSGSAGWAETRPKNVALLYCVKN